MPHRPKVNEAARGSRKPSNHACPPVRKRERRIGRAKPVGIDERREQKTQDVGEQGVLAEDARRRKYLAARPQACVTGISRPNASQRESRR